jgi:hypothetical protein
MPPIVGVRLRRYIVVTGVPDTAATEPSDPAAGRTPGEGRGQ